jgi:hypothetical protein
MSFQFQVLVFLPPSSHYGDTLFKSSTLICHDNVAMLT